MKNWYQCLGVILLVSVLAACATKRTVDIAEKPELARYYSCLQFFQAHSQRVEEENVRDAQTTQLKNFPYLSVNRFLVSFKPELDSEAKLDFWLERAARLNQEQRYYEWLNLSKESQASLRKEFLTATDFAKRVQICSTEFLQQLKADEKRQVVEQAKVTEVYSTASRFFGAYYLTSLVVSHQIDKHQAQTLDTFKVPLHELSVNGKLMRYVPSDAQFNFDHTVQQENPLGIPFVTTPVLNELFNRYAPTIEMDQVSQADKIGQMTINDDAMLYVDTEKPVVYYHPSYTRVENQVLLQLNYFFWFPERPEQSKVDIYAGKLDGIIWRVTLDKNLKPLVFDTVHNCGCYHKFYATDEVKFNKELAEEQREPPLVVQSEMKVEAHKPWVLRIDNATHFVNRIYQDDRFMNNSIAYEFAQYDELRSLSNGAIRRSLFGEDGVVDESARLERWILWPMGVPSAGAMRQWGNHAVAFVGKRYFDDPFLFDTYFEILASEEQMN